MRELFCFFSCCYSIKFSDSKGKSGLRDEEERAMAKMADESSEEYLKRMEREGKHVHSCAVCDDKGECKSPLCLAQPGDVLTIYGYVDGCRKCSSAAII